MDPVIQISVSYALALLWLVGAARKAVRFEQFCATFREYRVLPESLTAALAKLIVGLEIGLGVALLTPIGRSLALGGSAGLLLLYAAAIGLNLVRGRRHIDCGCMGPGYRQPLSEWLVARNLAAATAALTGFVPVEPRGLVWVDAVSIAAAVCLVAAFYATANRLIANARELKAFGS